MCEQAIGETPSSQILVGQTNLNQSRLFSRPDEKEADPGDAYVAVGCSLR